MLAAALLRRMLACLLALAMGVGVGQTIDASPVVGHCGPTSPGECGGSRESGSWHTRRERIRSLEQCAERCRACPSCSFVSYSKLSRDCSWYRRCDVPGQLAYGGGSFRTLQLRAVASSPPPPPPAWSAPPGARPGYCSLMGPDQGDCERGDQGGWTDVRSPSECEARRRAQP